MLQLHLYNNVCRLETNLGPTVSETTVLPTNCIERLVLFMTILSFNRICMWQFLFGGKSIDWFFSFIKLSPWQLMNCPHFSLCRRTAQRLVSKIQRRKKLASLHLSMSKQHLFSKNEIAKLFLGIRHSKRSKTQNQFFHLSQFRIDVIQSRLIFSRFAHILNQNWSSRPLFAYFFIQTMQFYNKLFWKMSIQYSELGFEPLTSWIWVSSHNH